jgi:hypothetical protein
MSDLPYDIDFVFAAHGNDDHALVNYKALQKEETSTDSFDSFESILSLSEITVASMQSSLPSSPEGDDSTTNSQPNREQASDDLGIVEFDMFDSGINEYEGVLDVQISRKRAADQLEGVDMLMCTETLEGEDGAYPQRLPVIPIPPSALQLPQPPAKKPPRYVNNAATKRGPVFLTKLFDVPLPKLPTDLKDPLEAEINRLKNQMRVHREMFVVAYGVHHGWTNSLMSLKEIEHYGSAEDLAHATRSISPRDRRFALANDIFGGSIDILREMEYQTDICEGGVVYPSKTVWAIMQGLNDTMRKNLHLLVMMHAESDLGVIEMRKSTPAMPLDALLLTDAVVRDYVFGRMKVPLDEITSLRRELAESCIEHGICGTLSVYAVLATLLTKQVSVGGVFDHTEFRRICDIHEERVLTDKEYEVLLPKVIKASSISDTERAEILRKQLHEKKKPTLRRIRRNAQAVMRYREKKTLKLMAGEISPYFHHEDTQSTN